MKAPALPVATLIALCVAGCGSAPSQPASVSRYDRDMGKAAEYFQEGRLPEAATSFRLAVRGALRVDDPGRIAAAELGLGAALLEQGDLREATLRYRNADVESRRASLPALIDQATLGLAEASRRAGDCSTALTQLARLSPSSDHALRVSAGLVEANCHRSGGDLNAAKARLDALAAPIRSATAAQQSAWHAAQASVALALGNSDSARIDAERALAIDRERRYPPAIAADHRLLSEIYRRAGLAQEAAFHHQRAEEIFSLSGINRQ